ncbi:MAG: PadR family transcriptional regulator [Candidatus Helarchaeota archaeon]
MILRKFFLGFIRVHVLYHASKGKIYGKEIKEELERHGYNISYGTLYPILHSLEKQDLLTKSNEKIGGKIRKYYKITEQGYKVFNELKEKIKELSEEIFEND